MAESFTFASKAGAALNTDLLRGGGTDDTEALQTVLERAAHGTPVHLIIDGAALVRGLNVYSNTTLECLAGGGLYLKEQASRDIIRNVHRSRGASADEHITIRGCFLNGNRFNQLHHQPSDKDGANQEPDRTYVTGVQLLGVKDVLLEHLTLWNIRTFGILIANAEHITLRDIRVDNGSPRFDPALSTVEQMKLIFDYLNTDGVHLVGPIHDALLDGLTLHTGDDAVALTANEGGADDVTVHNELGPYVGQGPITDVIVTNIVLDEASYGIRLLSTNQRIDRVTVQNVTGTVKNRAILLSHWLPPTHTGNFGSVLFNNINVKPIPIPPPRELWASYHLSEEELATALHEDYSLIGLNASIESLSLQHMMIDVSDSRPLMAIGPEAVIQSLSADFSVRDPQLKAIPLWLGAGARIERLDWALDWQGKELDVGKQPILNLGGVVGQLHWLHSAPSYVDARADEHDAHAISVKFSQKVKAADFSGGVTVCVNGQSARIMEAIRQPGEDVIRYRIAPSVRHNDSVTWAYDAGMGTIQNWDGDSMLSVGEKAVATN